MHLYKTALDQAYEGIIIVDPVGTVLFTNHMYAAFLDREIEQLIGKPVTDVVENTRMHIVARTGKAEVASLQKINGQQMIANRVPIIDNGEVKAVVGKIMFQDVNDLFEMNTKFERVKRELAFYKGELNKRLRAKYTFDSMIGTSPALDEVKKLSRRAAQSNSTILITGESGTGKELLAHAIHDESKRHAGPLIRVNCAAIPETLFESELFGYKEGSFTGAKKSGQKGKFALADKGTIFLDEISELPLSMQVKLLRVLQEKEIEPVGAEYPEPIDVRIIAATNKPLDKLVAEGKFRQDLFYRLHVVTIDIPALRERPEDITLLADHMLQQLAQETDIPVRGIDQGAKDRLTRYSWPGNIRELRNVLERAIHVKDGEMITEEDLPAMVREGTAYTLSTGSSHSAAVASSQEPSQLTLDGALEQAEQMIIRQALEQEKGNKLAAARRLGVSKSSFYAKLQKYQIGDE
nr:sigma 54-interacting transcriptional regulator [Brevibacillus dissolubilis]